MLRVGLGLEALFEGALLGAASKGTRGLSFFWRVAFGSCFGRGFWRCPLQLGHFPTISKMQ